MYNGLNSHYYSMVIDYHKNENDQNMLLNLYKKKWNHGLKNLSGSELSKQNKKDLSEIKRISKNYKNWIKKENKMSCKEFALSSVGKQDPKRHLMEHIDSI